MQKITTFLWFDHQAEEAADFYTSIFPDSRVLEAQPGPGGKPMMVVFELAGQRYMALNGGPADFSFTEAVSQFVECESQEEVDELWARLTDGGEEGPCGWLKDRYGLSWQIIPRELPQLLSHPDPEVAGKVARAMQGMKKIDVQGLRDAAKS
ncbi:VOC family protein [Nonomuraea sp. NPDC048826]|uniref:VOC family protein n=1 Tax=Nonomuraea sp. NPDC048826 TaxID=3364347 RepID=UPI0037229244